MGNTAKLKYYWPQSCYELKTNIARPAKRNCKPATAAAAAQWQHAPGHRMLLLPQRCGSGVWRGAGAAVSEDAAVAALLPMRCKLRRGGGAGGGDPCNSSRKNPLLGDIIATLYVL